MGYHELVHVMKQKAGLSDVEAEEALDLMVENIAERLEDDERKDFANQLPVELQEVVLGIETIAAGPDVPRPDILHEFMEREGINEEYAKMQVTTAWDTLKSFITDKQIKHIRSQMPEPAAALLK